MLLHNSYHPPDKSGLCTINRHLCLSYGFTFLYIPILTYAGTRTNGFDHLIGSAWGSLIIAGIVIAVTLPGIGDGALRPAIRKSPTIGNAPARSWATIGFILTVLAIGIMTGATYVG